ncbi:hypothetical protein AAY473_008490 [Plecturocebus cupreus]
MKWIKDVPGHHQRMICQFPGWTEQDDGGFEEFMSEHLVLTLANNECSIISTGITGMHHHTWLIVFLVEAGFCHVGQVGLKLLTLSDLATLASRKGRNDGEREKQFSKARSRKQREELQVSSATASSSFRLQAGSREALSTWQCQGPLSFLNIRLRAENREQISWNYTHDSVLPPTTIMSALWMLLSFLDLKRDPVAETAETGLGLEGSSEQVAFEQHLGERQPFSQRGLGLKEQEGQSLERGLVEMEFHYIGKAGLELLTLRDPPVLASQSARITDGSHCTQPGLRITD